MITVDELVQEISNSVRGGRTPTEAYKWLVKVLPGEAEQELLREALREFEKQTHRIRTLRDPATLINRGLLDWYPGPSSEDLFWPSLQQYLLTVKKRSQEVIESVDSASTKIVSLMQPPGMAEIKTRGLVVGYVQSGKTANFTGVIAKAADVNYKLFIVLSGLTNSLRNQTQQRLEEELVALNRQHWYALTSDSEDFRSGSVGNVDAFLTDHHDLKVLCVVKKNAAVLRRLYRWFRPASKAILSNCPVLIVDDEADQASINASRDADKRTAINQLLRDILALFPKAAYVGYTATPFANIFINPNDYQDLYPRDFIVALPKPEGYFGPERIFGRERLSSDDEGGSEIKLDMVRIVQDTEAPYLQPGAQREVADFVPDLTPSLEKALRYFWLSTAARVVRGQQDQHSTMLIHTSNYTAVHSAFKPLVEVYKDRILRSLNTNSAELANDLRTQWQDEQQRVPAEEFGESPVSFEALWQHLSSVVKQTDIIIDNYRSERRLNYREKARPRIVIGGDTLSRGLTLEGLVVSFFVRSVTAYDTLLQMGRWFGYRTGYSDLTRMWMTYELAYWFYDLATIEEEIRLDIQRYQDEDLTPLDFGVRVRTHPDLRITSELKMQSAVPAEVSYNNRRVQTVIFKRLDQGWLTHNINAVQRLVGVISASNYQPSTIAGDNLIFRSVPASYVVGFLKEYYFLSAEMRSNLLTGYIEEQNSYNDLLQWNVVIRSLKNKNQPLIDLGSNIQVRAVNRSRRRPTTTISPSDANIGALMTEGDVVIDLALTRDQTKDKTDKQLQNEYRPRGLGLLVIYPISKDSPSGTIDPDSDKPSMRLSLEAAEHVMGVGLVFPKSEHYVTRTYMTADLSRIPREEDEWRLEEEDEENGAA